MKPGQAIQFDATKNFTYIRPLGQGGAGQAHLFLDETTGTLFAFKKYSPKNSRRTDDFYRRFVDEIKILFGLSHPNIVRVYNHYLYPASKTGYLQMEYIDGQPIDRFCPGSCGKGWADVFADAIAAFAHLEKNGILHRDVRAGNILVDHDGRAKIIDFGFSKQFTRPKTSKNSILLNWPAAELPGEIRLHQDYTHQTEVYFAGSLFKTLLHEQKTPFPFQHIVEKMAKPNPAERYASFHEVSLALAAGVLGAINFTTEEKRAYRLFADALHDNIIHYVGKYVPIDDLAVTLSSLSSLLRDTALEEYLPGNARLIRCFIAGGFLYRRKKNITTQAVADFYQLLSSLPAAKQQIICDNIYHRLSTINTVPEQENLPF